MQSDFSKAVSLAKWLIEKKYKQPKIAYIIAQHKFKLLWSERLYIRKEYQKVKGIDKNQGILF